MLKALFFLGLVSAGTPAMSQTFPFPGTNTAEEPCAISFNILVYTPPNQRRDLGFKARWWIAEGFAVKQGFGSERTTTLIYLADKACRQGEDATFSMALEAAAYSMRLKKHGFQPQLRDTEQLGRWPIKQGNHDFTWR